MHKVKTNYRSTTIVVAVKELRKNERRDETWFITKIDEKTSLGHSYFVL
jgi:hypothetical protein